VLYGPGAGIYDRVARAAFLGEWRRWQLAAVSKLPRGGVVVELGSGTGALAAEVAADFGRWIGLDISQEMTRTTHRQPIPQNLAFLTASANQIPLKSGAADAVVATFPTEYILGPRTSDEVARILKPDGRFVIVLTGDLHAVGIRRTWRRAIFAILQGNREPSSPVFKGFEGQWEWVPTAYGRAWVYVGRRL
jgi:ubiquinone/menaquinone biosynthesis C-methylase UbiE